MFLDMFDDQQDVFNQFNASPEEVEGVQVLFAAYTYEDYSGYAFVLFLKDGKLYEVHGSHCSCYGLEDQWDPEETTEEAVLYRIANGTFGYGRDADEHLKQLLLNRSAQATSSEA
jgi:hypothetical protein